MAAVDLKRATALAAGMKNYRQKARALGAMALAMARTKGTTPRRTGCSTRHSPSWMRRLLRIRMIGTGWAWRVRPPQGSCRSSSRSMPAGSPNSSGGRWRLRPPLPGPRGRDGIADLAAARIAAMAARYDRAIARQILDGFAERALADRIGLDDWGSMFRDDSIFQAAAIVDPARAVAMIESLPEAIGPAFGSVTQGHRADGFRPSAGPARHRSLGRPGSLVDAPLAHRFGRGLLNALDEKGPAPRSRARP